jgi:hypothetical protein
MLLIIFLCLIAKITLVSSDFDVGAQDVQDFDFHKVVFIVVTLFLKHSGLKITTCFVFHL